MSVVPWVLAAPLGLLFVASGLIKLLRTKARLNDSGQGWTGFDVFANDGSS